MRPSGFGIEGCVVDRERPQFLVGRVLDLRRLHVVAGPGPV